MQDLAGVRASLAGLIRRRCETVYPGRLFGKIPICPPVRRRLDPPPRYDSVYHEAMATMDEEDGLRESAAFHRQIAAELRAEEQGACKG